MSKPNAAVSWSGGKDSCLALHRVRREVEITTLLTMLIEDGTRSRSHGLRPEVLVAQASSMKLGLLTRKASWENYEVQFIDALRSLQANGVECVVFGDIFLDAHRKWVERVCRSVGLKALEPLWNEPTSDLINEFLVLGGQARIVAVNRAKLDDCWLATSLGPETGARLRALGVDPCGEYGEYHTVVEWAPAFAHSLHLLETGRYDLSGYAFVDFSLAATMNLAGSSPTA